MVLRSTPTNPFTQTPFAQDACFVQPLGTIVLDEDAVSRASGTSLSGHAVRASNARGSEQGDCHDHPSAAKFTFRYLPDHCAAICMQ